MASYLMLAHLGSAPCFSSFSQWRNAFRPHDNMNSGSFFFVEISRMVASLRPFGAESDSTSVTKPHLYSPSTRESMIFVSVLMGVSSWSSTGPIQRVSCGGKTRGILKPNKYFLFGVKKCLLRGWGNHCRACTGRQFAAFDWDRIWCYCLSKITSQGCFSFRFPCIRGLL